MIFGIDLGALDWAPQLHWALAWVLLPLLILMAASGALRTDLSRGWRWVLRMGATYATAALALRAARHGIFHWDHIPLFVWLAAPLVMMALVVAARSSVLLLLAFIAALLCALAGWLVLAMLAFGGSSAIAPVNTAALVVAVPLLVLGLWKHLGTPTPPAPEPPAPPEPTEAEREAALKERLAQPEAQEGADKYSRE